MAYNASIAWDATIQLYEAKLICVFDILLKTKFFTFFFLNFY